MMTVTQSAPNGQARDIAQAGQRQVALPTLLGRQAPRIPVGGRIRAGIKVLTRKAAEHPRAQELYDQGVAAGKGFESIEREICAALPDLAHPLTPKNVPYFTVRGEDFPNPVIARQIMDKFGEDRGEGFKLYRFPVVFPADAWQNVMPHELVAWMASRKLYWSEYSEDGQTRWCKTYQAVPVDAQGRKTVRIFGGRKVMLRAENEGRCEPESCPEYQSKRCNLSGRFIFYVPGIPSLSEFELATNSFYAMQAAIEKFQTIGFMRGGRISGFLDGKGTPFFITKRLVEVSRIDDSGQPTRVAQWLIELEAPIDVTGLLEREHGLERLEMRAGEAATVLDGVGRARPGSAVPSADESVFVVEQSGEIVRQGAAARGPASDDSKVAGTQKPTPVANGARDVSARAANRGGSPAPASDAKPAADKTLAWIVDAAAALGVPADRYERYAEKRWGKGWKLAQ